MFFRMLLLPVLASLSLFACNNSARDASLDKEGPVTHTLDTFPPPADEADGMDNRPGYHTSQMSTEVEKDVLIPDGNLNIAPRGMVFLPDDSEADYSPNRYTYRFLVEEGEAVSPALQKRPPLFSAACLGEEDKLGCSNAALLGYLRQLPGATEEGRLLYAVVTLGLEGKPERVEKIQCTGALPCLAHQNEAWRVLMNMPSWKPAMYNGQAVRAQVVIPVRIGLEGS